MKKFLAILAAWSVTVTVALSAGPPPILRQFYTTNDPATISASIATTANNVFTSRIAADGVAVTTATNIANSAIVTPFMFGAHGDGGKEGIGTDDGPAFNAAIAAKTNFSWIIDGLNRDFKINTSIFNASNNVTIQNCRFYTTNATLGIITNEANFCRFLNCYFWGPGTNINGREPLDGSVGLYSTTRPYYGAYHSHLAIRDCRAEGFDTGFFPTFIDALELSQNIAVGNKSYGTRGYFTDHVTLNRSHAGFNNVGLGVLYPNEFFTTNASPAWISNCVGFHFERFNILTFDTTAAAYCKRGYEFLNGQNLVMMNYNSEDFYDASSGLRTIAYASNVNGITITGALGQQIDPNSSTNLFKWVLADCPSDTVFMDLGGRYQGTTPQLAIYFSPGFLGAPADSRQITTPLLRGNVYVRWLTNITSFYGDTARPDVQWDSGTVANLAYVNAFANTNLMPQLRCNQAGFSSVAAYQQFVQTVGGNGDEGFGFMSGGPGAGNFITSAFDFGFIPMSGGVVGAPLFWVNRAVGNGYFKGMVFGTNGFMVGTASSITTGAGTPEGAVTATVGSLYTRTDGGASTTLYVKTSGTGNTGWTAK